MLKNRWIAIGLVILAVVVFFHFRRALNRLTSEPLEGFDRNHDGVRDDLEKLINQKYPNSERHRAAMRQDAVALQKAILHPDDARSIFPEMMRAVDCVFYVDADHADDLGRMLEAAAVNTPERVKAYIHFNGVLSGRSYGGMGVSKNSCDLPLDQMKT